MSDTTNTLPLGWEWASVDSLATLAQYGTSAKTTEEPIGVPVLRMGNIVDGQIDFKNLKYLPKEHNEFPDLLLQPGDVLFNRTNSAELVGKTAVFKGGPPACSFASYLIRIRLAGYYPELFSNYINSSFGRAWIFSVVSQQVGQANVSGAKLKALHIPVPPVNEQRRIVAKIEALKARSQRVKEELDAIPALLDQFRQSVLAAAFRGDLTADWREKNPDFEPASVLLECIRAERRRRWEEAELEKMKAQGKMPKDDKWKEKYEEPKFVDTSGLPTIPETWTWTILDNICQKITDGEHLQQIAGI